MTTFRSVPVTCAVCSVASDHDVLMSTNAFGSPDLDLRPPSMERETLQHQIQECPACGYCAPELNEAVPARAREVMDLAPYQTLRKSRRYPELASRFLRAALLAEGAREPETAFHHALRAAWDCDDAGRLEAAAECRGAAIHYLRSARDRQTAAGQGEQEDSPGETAVLIDLLRRSGRFEEASALSTQLSQEKLPDVLRQVTAFQNTLIARQDAGCHTVEEAVQAAGRS